MYIPNKLPYHPINSSPKNNYSLQQQSPIPYYNNITQPIITIKPKTIHNYNPPTQYHYHHPSINNNPQLPILINGLYTPYKLNNNVIKQPIPYSKPTSYILRKRIIKNEKGQYIQQQFLQPLYRITHASNNNNQKTNQDKSNNMLLKTDNTNKYQSTQLNTINQHHQQHKIDQEQQSITHIIDKQEQIQKINNKNNENKNRHKRQQSLQIHQSNKSLIHKLRSSNDNQFFSSYWNKEKQKDNRDSLISNNNNDNNNDNDNKIYSCEQDFVQRVQYYKNKQIQQQSAYKQSQINSNIIQKSINRQKSYNKSVQQSQQKSQYNNQLSNNINKTINKSQQNQQLQLSNINKQHINQYYHQQQQIYTHRFLTKTYTIKMKKKQLVGLDLQWIQNQ